jgi:hypothetical protein
MDHEFVKRAEHITSFNLTAKDFTSTKYKEEIQYLFNKHFFPKFNTKKCINAVNTNQLNSLISILKNENSKKFEMLHRYPLKGVGPGEATLFFLVNTAYLGGGSSAGVDLFAAGEQFEVKAAMISGNNEYAYGFKLGGTVPISAILVQLQALAKSLNISVSGNEIGRGKLAEMQHRAPQEYKTIEEKYAYIAYKEYFKKHKVIFVNNNPSSKLGYVETIKKVAQKEILIETVTSGTIKPKILLK